jgi:hypothetical protein
MYKRSMRTRGLILSKIFRDSMVLVKTVDSEDDSEWGTGSETETEYTINGKFVNLTPEMYEEGVAGIMTQDDAVLYCMPYFEFPNVVGLVRIKVNDYIKFDGIKYRVMRVNSMSDAGAVVTEAILRKEGGI